MVMGDYLTFGCPLSIAVIFRHLIQLRVYLWLFFFSLLPFSPLYTLFSPFHRGENFVTLTFIGVNRPELLTRWVGASEQAIRELFVKARQADPCVIFIDEIDTLAPARGTYSGDSGVSNRVVGQLLTELDGLEVGATILVIGATNRPDALDPALLRAGRLDLQLKVDLPDLASRLEILQVYTEGRPLLDVDLPYWAEITEGWNGADLVLLCNQAAVEAIRRFRGQGETDPATIRITADDFQHSHQVLVQQCVTT